MTNTACTHSTVSLFHLPDPWRTSLIRDELDSSSRAAVAQTCKPGLNWLLSEWPEATLHIPVRASSAQHPTRLQGAREQLALRGGLQTTIAFEQHWEMRPDDWWWETVLPALSTGTVQPNLTLSLTLQYITPELLCAVNQAFPGFTSLRIQSPKGSSGAQAELPTPSKLQELTQLIVGRSPIGAQEALWASVGPYLPQLHSLTIKKQPNEYLWWEEEDAPLWALECFTPEHTTHTLTHLQVPCALSPHAAQMLTKHAPALATLVAPRVLGALVGVKYRALLWSVRTLRLTDQHYAFPSSALDWMPTPKEGKMVIEVSGMHVQLPMSDKALGKVASLAISGCKTVTAQAEWLKDCLEQMVVKQYVHSTQQPIALLAALPLLQASHTPSTTLLLESFTLSSDLPAAVAGVAELGWREVSVTGMYWCFEDQPSFTGRFPPLQTLALYDGLGDAGLQTLLTCVSSVQELRARGLSLRATLPEGTVLPWPKVVVNCYTCVSNWLPSMYALRHTGCAGHVEELIMFVTPSMIEEASDMAEQARALQNVHIGSVSVRHGEGLSCPEDEPAALRAALTIASALPCIPGSLGVYTYTGTPALMAELQHLPHWKVLVLWAGRCEGTEASWADLPLIPHSYTTLKLYHISETDMEAIVMSQAQGRTAEQPLTVHVQDEHSAWAEGVNGRMASAYSHVSLSWRRPGCDSDTESEESEESEES